MRARFDSSRFTMAEPKLLCIISDLGFGCPVPASLESDHWGMISPGSATIKRFHSFDSPRLRTHVVISVLFPLIRTDTALEETTWSHLARQTGFQNPCDGMQQERQCPRFEQLMLDWPTRLLLQGLAAGAIAVERGLPP